MPATLTFDVPKKVDKREEILEILKKKNGPNLLQRGKARVAKPALKRKNRTNLENTPDSLNMKNDIIIAAK